MSPNASFRRFTIVSAAIGVIGAAAWWCWPEAERAPGNSVPEVGRVTREAASGSCPVPAAQALDHDFRKRIAELLAAAPSGERNRQLNELIGQLATEHPLEAIAYLESRQDAPVARNLLQRAMSAWLRCDRAAALGFAFIRARDDVAGRDWCLEPTLAVLAESEGIEAALRFLADLPADESVYGPLVPLMTSHIIGDPEGSAPVIDLVPLASAREVFNEMRGAMLAQAQGWDALRTIAAESGRGEATDPELIGAILTLFKSEPQRVLEWVAAQPGGSALDVIRCRIGYSLLAGSVENGGDPSAPARLAVRIQNPTTAASLLPTALSAWYAKDPTAALVWAEEQALAPELVAEVVIQNTQPTSADLRKALIQSECVADPKMRLRQQSALVERWLRVDRTAALGWIRASTLPDELKAILENESAVGGK